MTDDNRNRPGRGNPLGSGTGKTGKVPGGRPLDPRSRLGGRIPPPPRAPVPPRTGKGVKAAPLAPRKPAKPGPANPEARAGRAAPPPPPLRSGGTSSHSPKELSSAEAGENARKAPDVKDFAARLRAQREAAERLISRRTAPSTTQKKPGAGEASSGQTPLTRPAVRQRAATTPTTPSPTVKPAEPSPPSTPAITETPHSMPGPTEATPDATDTAGLHAPSPTAPKVSTPVGEQASPVPPRPTPASPDMAGWSRPEAEHPPLQGARVAEPSATAGPASTLPPHAASPEVSTTPSPEVDDWISEVPATPEVSAASTAPHSPSPTAAGQPPDSFADVYAELEQLNEPPRRKMAVILPLVLIFLVIAALAAAAVYLYFNLTADRNTAGEIPVITPPGAEAPTKIKPAAPAEVKPAPMPEKPRRKLIYDRIITDDARKSQPSGEHPGNGQGGREAAPPLPPPLPPPPSLGPEQGSKQPVAPGEQARGQERAATAEDLPLPPPPPIAAPAPGVTVKPAASATSANTSPNPAQEAQEENGMPLPPPSSTANATGDAEEGEVKKRAGAKAVRTARGEIAAKKDESPIRQVEHQINSDRKAGSSEASRPKVPAIARSPEPAKRSVSTTAKRAGKRHASVAVRKVRNAPRPRSRPRSASKPAAAKRAAKTFRKPTAPIVLPGVSPAAIPAPVTTRSAPSRRVTSSAFTDAQPSIPVTRRKRTNFGHARTAQLPLQQAPRVASITPPARSIARASTPPRRSTAKGAYVVQLAAFRSRQDAMRAWQRIRAKHGGLLAGLNPILNRKNLGNAGTFYRLSVGPLPSRQAASRLCQRLIASGEPDCLIRKR